jgi:hypothetical protein
VLLPRQPPDAGATSDHQQQSGKHNTRSPPALRPRWCSLDDSRETAALLVRWRPQLCGWGPALRFLLGHQNAF